VLSFRLCINASRSADALDLRHDLAGTIFQSGPPKTSPIIPPATLDDVIDGRQRQRLCNKVPVLHLP
jgi:hypothetical protein